MQFTVFAGLFLFVYNLFVDFFEKCGYTMFKKEQFIIQQFIFKQTVLCFC